MWNEVVRLLLAFKQGWITWRCDNGAPEQEFSLVVGWIEVDDSALSSRDLGVVIEVKVVTKRQSKSSWVVWWKWTLCNILESYQAERLSDSRLSLLGLSIKRKFSDSLTN